MSMNTQVLVQEYKDRWYVFNNLIAEAWYDPDKPNGDNELSIKDATASFATKQEALDYAYKIDGEIDDHGYPNSEYGVCEGYLAKDGKKVKLTV